MALAAHEAGVMLFVIAFSIVPAVFTGAMLGVMADVFATRRPVLRFILLASFALAVQSGLASFFELSYLLPLTAVPTLLGVVILEGTTRRRIVEPPIPTAMVR
jgi:uncharacterized membrane protein YeiH